MMNARRRIEVVAFSGGRSSAYLLHHLQTKEPSAQRIVLFYNTGKERLETLDFVAEVGERWGIDITWLEYDYRPDAKGGSKDPRHTYRVVSRDTCSTDGEPFEKLIRASQFVPNVHRRRCTQELKVKTGERYLRRELDLARQDYVELLGNRCSIAIRLSTATAANRRPPCPPALPGQPISTNLRNSLHFHRFGGWQLVDYLLECKQWGFTLSPLPPRPARQHGPQPEETTMGPARDSRQHKKANQGMNWIRKEKRLALYLRDGLACVYCNEGIEDGATLTLDHCKPRNCGGSNAADNLVTACHRCNSYRSDRPLAAFIRDAAAYTGQSAVDMERRVRNSRRRSYDVAEAKALIARRGGFVEACRSQEGD